MILRPVKTPQQYEEALERIDALMSRSGSLTTPEQDELETLALFVQKYEEATQRQAHSDPVAAIQFRMDQMGYKKKDLALLVGAASRASEIMKRRRCLTVEMIRRLHEEWGIPLESLVGRSEAPEPESMDLAPIPVREIDAETAKQMVRRRYFPEIRGLKQAGKDLATRVQRFFEEHAGPLPARAHLRQGQSRKAKINPDAVEAWLLHVRRLATEEKAGLPTFNKEALDPTFLRWLSGLSGIPAEGPRLARQALEDKGIAVILEPRLNHTHLDGAALMTAAGRPVIGLTLRHDRLDNFWFTLFHELGHVLMHLSPEHPVMVDCDIDERKTEEVEREADRFALDTLIPPRAWEQQVRHLQSAEGICAAARQLCIDPAVIAGRLRREANDYRKHPKLIGSRQVLTAFHINSKDWLK
jgi:HTH-type transcriptional regulator / antitoxin HigA